MLGKKGLQFRLLYGFSLEKAVPQDNFYRLLQAAVDLSWVRSWVAHLYSPIGRPSLDPEVFAKIELIGYLEGIHSERELMRQIDDRLSLRRYIGYDIDEAVPDHSTLSKTRTLLGKDFCQAVMDESVRLCASAGMVSGMHVSVDKSLVKANASRESLEPRVVNETPARFVERVFAENDCLEIGLEEGGAITSLLDQPGYPAKLPVASEGGSRPQRAVQDPRPEGRARGGKSKGGAKKKGKGKKKATLSNATHVSRTDPEAELASRPHMPVDLYYAAEMHIDSRQGVIVHADGTRANLAEQATVKRAVERERERHGVRAAGLSGDKGYGKGPLYRDLKEMGVVGFIPHERAGNKSSEQGLYPPQEFVYDPERNVYRCPEGKELRYRRLEISWPQAKHVWRAEAKDCRSCGRREACTTAADGRSLCVSIYQPYYEEMDRRLAGPGARLAAIARRTGPERAFAEAKERNSLRRAKYRGLEKFQGQVLMTAAAANLKKYVKWIWRKGWGAGMKRVSALRPSLLFAAFNPLHTLIAIAPSPVY